MLPGAALLERWGLPLPIVHGVRFHHEPEASPKQQQKMSQLIFLVDNLCTLNKIGDVGEGKGPELDESTWKNVGLSPDTQEQILPQINKRLEESQILLSIVSDN